jgi:protein involved in polysaccharide export with SLBB domain
VPGNKIRLLCEQEPTLSVERTLSPEGDVVLPLIGKINLAGMFISEAEYTIERLVESKLHSDHIVIAIMLVADVNGPVEFAGAVTHNGSAPFHAGMTLADIVKMAEPTIAAALEAVEVTGGDGKKVVVDCTGAGAATKLRPGDRVFFPRSEGPRDVEILGGVAKPGSKPFKPGMTLKELVDQAGGITGHGQKDKIKLERKGERPRIIDLESADAAVQLKRGDIVTVPALENGRYVTVTGMVLHDGLVEFAPGMTLTQAIKAAGGLNGIASRDAITVKRLGAWKRTYDYNRIMAGKDPDIVLSPADIVEVPVAKPKKPDEGPRPPRKGPVVPPR